MSEAQEISTPTSRSRRSKRKWGLQRPRAAALRQRNRPAHGEDFRTRAPAMAVHGGGRSGGERVRGAGGAIRITRRSCPFSTTRRSSPAFSDMRSATLPRGIRRRRTRQVGGQAGLIALGIFVPAARPFGDLGAQALALFLKYGRDDEPQSDQLGAKYESQLGWIRRRCRRSCRRSDDSTKRPAIDEVSRTGCPLTLIRSRVERDSANRSAIESCRRIVLHQPRCVRPAHRRHRLRRQPGAGHRARQRLHPVLRFRIDFPEKWEISNSPQQVVAKAPARTCSCCCSRRCPVDGTFRRLLEQHGQRRVPVRSR